MKSINKPIIVKKSADLSPVSRISINAKQIRINIGNVFNLFLNIKNNPIKIKKYLDIKLPRTNLSSKKLDILSLLYFGIPIKFLPLKNC